MKSKFIATIQVVVEVDTQNEAEDAIREILKDGKERHPNLVGYQYMLERGIYLTPKKVAEKDVDRVFTNLLNDTI